MTDQRHTGAPQESGTASENEERLPPEVQADSEMGHDETVVPAPGAPSLPMDQPDDAEGSTGPGP